MRRKVEINRFKKKKEGLEKNIFFLKKSKHYTSDGENSLFINKLACWICIFYVKNK